MTNQEFLNEVLSSKNPPENFGEIYSRFNEYQKLADDTLKEFHRVCEKNGVTYQLAYGSLLGAIRDGGQIPWDYDVDVFVPFEEKEDLIRALKKDLKSDYYFYCPESDKKCRHMIIRLAPVGYRTEVLHVDVFFLTGAPDDLEERKRFIQEVKRLSETRYDKLVKVFSEIRDWKFSVIKIINKLKCITYNPEKKYIDYTELCKKYPAKESKICVSADGFADWYEFDGTTIWKSTLIQNDLGEFRIPVEYDEILTKIYKNYRQIMPLESRLKELLSHYERLERFARK